VDERDRLLNQPPSDAVAVLAKIKEGIRRQWWGEPDWRPEGDVRYPLKVPPAGWSPVRRDGSAFSGRLISWIPAEAMANPLSTGAGWNAGRCRHIADARYQLGGRWLSFCRLIPGRYRHCSHLITHSLSRLEALPIGNGNSRMLASSRNCVK
jgi:hypothetical protein